MENTLVFLLLLCALSGESSPEGDGSSGSDVHAVLRDMSAKLAVLQFRMDQQQTLNQEQANKLKELEGQTCQVVKRHLQVGEVAFSTSLMAASEGPEVIFGRFDTHKTLVFKNVITNIGNAYNSDTGLFTAPVKGAYHFELHINGPASFITGALLMKNEEHITSAYDQQSNVRWGKSSNGVTLVLEAGDVVSVRLWENTRIFDNVNHHTTFSGHLLFTMC